MPHRESVPNVWRMKANRYTVTGTACECGALAMPPRALCECGHEMKPFTFSGRGHIVSYTTIHVAPAGFRTPYNVALVQLEEGPVISGIVVDDDVAVGRAVRAVFRRLHASESGVINYGFKFELAD